MVVTGSGTKQPQTRTHLEQQKPRLTIVILVISFDPVEFMFPDKLLDERRAEGLSGHSSPRMGQYGHSPRHVVPDPVTTKSIARPTSME